MHNEQEIKLLTEAYMVTELGYGGNLLVKDIIWFKKLASGEDVDPESIVIGDAENRLVNRYMKDLKDIGALKEDARRMLDEERISYISSDDFITDLKPYGNIAPGLLSLYRVAKVLNTSMDERDPVSDSAFSRFHRGYFDGGVETPGEIELLYHALQTVKQMFEIEAEFTESNPEIFTEFRNECELFRYLKYTHGYEPILNEED